MEGKIVTTEKKGNPEWIPQYSRWRHGGWYVDNVRYPSGACGCVSNSYPDKKWRIVCDDRRRELGEPGDYTFRSRDAAAIAEFELVNAMHEETRIMLENLGEGTETRELVIGSNQDRNTILAALRFYQKEGMGEPANRSDAIHDLAPNGDQDISMDEEGIDDLCERVNASYEPTGVAIDLAQQVLVALLSEVAVPGGINEQEFNRPGGWLERAQQALAGSPAEMGIQRRLHELRSSNDGLREENQSLRAALTEVSESLDGLGDPVAPDSVVGDKVNYVARARYFVEIGLGKRQQFPLSSNDELMTRVPSMDM